MPISQFLLIFGCLLIVLLVKWALQPIIKIPSVFLYLLLGISLGFLTKTDFGKTNLALLQESTTMQTLGLIGWLGILLLMALGTSDSEIQCFQTDISWITVCQISLIGFGGTFLVTSMLGYGLSIFHPHFIDLGPSRSLIFALAVGLACSVTALPVLVSMLHESNDHNSAIGKLAIRIAILDDIWQWLLLIVLLGIVNAQADLKPHLLKLFGFLVFAMLFLKPVLRSLYKKFSNLSPVNNIVSGLSLIVLIAIFSEKMGTNALFGAFIAGWILPPDVLKSLKASVLPISQALLVPFFFITIGMKTEISFGDSNVLFLALLFTLMGMGIKILFVSLGAQFSGRKCSEAFELGALLQCKGLMEIVTLSLMRDAKIIGPEIFSALIAMALLCTILTAPLRSCVLLIRRRSINKQSEFKNKSAFKVISMVTHQVPTSSP